ncbi:catabolite control protein A [Companilactobacillus metriopterae]|uniref:catabolite control protein A n=1 Tax=Companilactobacillus metriopterae TaxID=1909267 RepID=UPI00100B9F85|nr:catabolite control protein A [Companilactobacillus metriopterae]
MDKKVITIYDVAEEANVSMATISRVVNGNANVKEETRKKVMEVIDRLNYRPNAVARGLASKKSTTIGVIIPNITDLYYASLAKGVDDVASMYKYNIILTSLEESVGDEEQIINNLLSKQVDGLIYMGKQISKKLKRVFMHSKTPLVLAGSVDKNNETASVHIDFVEAVNNVVTQLIHNSHKKIAFVGGNLENPIDGKYRLDGYKKALKNANINFSSDLVFEAENSVRAGEAIFDVIKNTNATAVYVTDDLLAAGILNSAVRSGISIPEDFEIISSNDTILCEVTNPKMSSIEEPLYDIGAVAMRLLTKMMNQEQIDENVVKLPYSIVKRESTR